MLLVLKRVSEPVLLSLQEKFVLNGWILTDDTTVHGISEVITNSSRLNLFTLTRNNVMCLFRSLRGKTTDCDYCCVTLKNVVRFVAF